MSESRSSTTHSETYESCLVPLESIKEVQCHFDQSRSSLANPSERGPKMSRHVHSIFFVGDHCRQDLLISRAIHMPV